MNKTNKILIIILVILLIIAGVVCFKALDNEEQPREELTTATTTVEEREVWSDFLKKNPYVSEIEVAESLPLSDTDLIKLAITSEEVETEYVVTEEIIERPTLTQGEGYKKSKENVEEYIKKVFNINNISYNFIETYVEGEQYLILGEEYIYYTEIELSEKEYILMELKKDGNNFEALIYEYEVNENNRSAITEMLESGVTKTEINKSKTYTITGTMSNEDICILTKQ